MSWWILNGHSWINLCSLWIFLSNYVPSKLIQPCRKAWILPWGLQLHGYLIQMELDFMKNIFPQYIIFKYLHNSLQCICWYEKMVEEITIWSHTYVLVILCCPYEQAVLHPQQCVGYCSFSGLNNLKSHTLTPKV